MRPLPAELLAVLACGEDAILGGLTAARLDGFRLPTMLPDARIDILLPPGRKRLGPGATVRRSLALTDSDVHPGRLPRRTRLPPPDRQARRTDEDGRGRWLDLFFDDYELVVEVDGGWHMDAETWWTDLRRLNEPT